MSCWDASEVRGYGRVWKRHNRAAVTQRCTPPAWSKDQERVLRIIVLLAPSPSQHAPRETLAAQRCPRRLASSGLCRRFPVARALVFSSASVWNRSRAPAPQRHPPGRVPLVVPVSRRFFLTATRGRRRGNRCSTGEMSWPRRGLRRDDTLTSTVLVAEITVRACLSTMRSSGDNLQREDIMLGAPGTY
jgi:hypothetical protein